MKRLYAQNKILKQEDWDYYKIKIFEISSSEKPSNYHYDIYEIDEDEKLF